MNLGNSQWFCALMQTPHKKNYETGKLLISKDGNPAFQIDEEIKTSKFMMETKLLFLANIEYAM